MTTESGRGLQRSEHRLLLLAGDAVVGCLALVVALWSWSLTTGFGFDVAFLARWAVLAALVPVWVLLLAPARQLRLALSFRQTWRALLGAVGTVAVGYLLVYFYAPRAILPRLPALYFLWEAALLTLAWRACYLYAAWRGVLRRRAVFIGDQTAFARMSELFRHHAPDVEIVATIDPGALAGGTQPRQTDTGSLLDQAISRHGVSEIVLASRTSMAPDLVQALVRWQEQGIDVVPMTAEYEHLLRRVPIADLEPDWMFTSLPEWVRARDASRAAKRAVDVCCGLVGVALLVVVTPVVAAVIALDSRGPVFYRQRRLGAGGRTFEVLKYRTMRPGAEPDGPRWAAQDDERVTRAGRWLRRTRLDELPQMLAVLWGEMSTVGPRPERPEIASTLEGQIPFYRTRLMVRPGLTGWAQVNTSYGDSVEGAALKLEYDLYYIKHRSLLFDAWIMVRTIATVFAMGGR
ncbi:MAG: exopolysaccharide biosynthesis polyprenyl glycosylphosphotransferase [Acidobacteriota bacterium]